MKIYTRRGDDGKTALFGAGRVPKHHLRVETYGTIDELNALLGVARATAPSPQGDSWLNQAQNLLFHLGADLATPRQAKVDTSARITKREVQWLEDAIDHMDEALAPLKNFILPGGTAAAANLQVARAVCRRAERLMAALAEREDIGDTALPFVNRLSDWLFTLARYENLVANEPEAKWSLR